MPERRTPRAGGGDEWTLLTGPPSRRLRLGLCQQARKSAASAALNIAEGAARQSRADKSRVHGIALAEACEACAAIEIAGELGACSAADVQAVLALGIRVKDVLSRLIR